MEALSGLSDQVVVLKGSKHAMTQYLEALDARSATIEW